MSDLNNNEIPGYGFDDSGNFSNNAFDAVSNAEAYSRDVFNPQYYNDEYSEPTGFEGLKTVVTQKVVTKSFLFMFAALLITAFAALTTSPVTAINMLSGGSFWILLIAEIAIVLISNAVLKKNNVILGGILYTIYSFLTGMTLSVIFLCYTGSSIVSTFVITAVMFGTVAVFGLVTKKDLTSVGSICLMGLWGIILSSVVNMVFLRSSGFDFAVSIIGVIIFVGLTAYDMQKIKQMCAYSDVDNENALAMIGAFEIYLDFINLFLKLLRLMGKRK